MKRIFGLIAALALATTSAALAVGPYPYAPPITGQTIQQSYNTTGPQPITASCIGSSNFTSCPAQSIVGIISQGMGNVSIQVTGNYSATLVFESSLDCVNFSPLPLTPQGGTTATSTITNSTGIWSGIITALTCVQVRSTSYGSGTANVTVNVNGAGGQVSTTGGGGGGGTLTLPLPGNTAAPAGAAQNLGISAYDGTANQVPLQEVGGGLNVNEVGKGSTNLNPFFVQTVDPSEVHVGNNVGEAVGTPAYVQVINTPAPCAAIGCNDNVSGIGGASPAPAGTAGAMAVGGGSADNAAPTTNGIPSMCVGTSTGTTLGAIGTAGNLRECRADLYGNPLVRIGSVWQFTCAVVAGTTAVQLTNGQNCPVVNISAPLRFQISEITATSTTATASSFQIVTGNGNCTTSQTAIYPSIASDLLFAPGNTAAPLVISFPTPLISNSGWLCAIASSATNTVLIQVTGYIAP